jgi:hypothetical protein
MKLPTQIVPNRAQRAGRAPYNFVPLYDGPWKRAAKPPSAAAYHDELLSGEIDLKLTALTDFYTRGLAELAQDPKSQTEPFLVDGKLRLPGPGLRGMVRSLVEILSSAPLSPVNPQQMFYRAVAATPNPNEARSFEPQAKAYRERFTEAYEEGSKKGGAGYLYADSSGWKIQPAREYPGELQNGRWLRIKTRDEWVRRKVHFRPAGPLPWGSLCDPGAPGAIEGWLICSGPIPPGPNRRRGDPRAQWLIPGEDTKAKPVDIPDYDVSAYLDAGKTQLIERNRFDYSRSSSGVPCFWVAWEDAEKNPHVSFGHTPWFRLPYTNNAADATPPGARRRRDDREWDMAQALFGRVVPGRSAREGDESCKGRVFVEDAVVESGNAYESEPVSVVLGAPKPTTYQHYLTQSSADVVRAVSWDGDYRGQGKPGFDIVVRGHKLYPHRPGAPVLPARDAGQDRVATRMRVAHKGAVFSWRIRYENLSSVELGALLLALALPRGCAHRFGMGKPLGLGSFQVEVLGVREFLRQARYESLLSAAGGGSRLCDGAQPPSDQRILGYMAAFAREMGIQERDDAQAWGAFWSRSRMAQLWALLDFDRVKDLPDWANRTRYLEFGKLRSGPLAGKIYNEYQNVDQRQHPIEKRRPLPPATAVLDGGPAVPGDPRPDFEGAQPRADLRAAPRERR